MTIANESRKGASPYHKLVLGSKSSASTKISILIHNNIALTIMAPSKVHSAAAKQQLIISHLRATRTCHTLKDLEKMLPSVASINGMQVKDHIQALVDEGKLHVEKIGSGNWYWAWCGEEKKEREKARQGLAREAGKIESVVEALQEKVNMIKGEIEKENGAGEEELERAKLHARKSEVEGEVVRLRKEKAELENGAAVDVERKAADIKRWKAEVEVCTDNIYILEGYLMKLAGGDRELVKAVQRECYGDEYIEGEGLKELEM